MDPVAVVVHDDERMLALIASLLEAEGFVVRAVQGAYDVFAHADPSPAESVVLVLLGLTAVDERDLELIGLLRHRHPRARMTLLFPASLRDRAARALDRGADGYLPEPFYPAELVALARRARDADAPAASPEDAPAGPAYPAEDYDDDDEGAASAQLAAGVVHALRNPLQILELLLAGVELGDPLDVEKTRAELTRIGDVASALTLFTVGREAEPRPVDLNALVRQTFLGRGTLGVAKPELALASPAPVVLAQPESLHTALDILRRRAEHLTPPGTPVHATTRIAGLDGVGTVDLEITDGGPPLPPSRLRTLFEPYPDPAAPNETNWLELAAAAEIVRSHGGSAVAERARENGTLVRVTLPLHHDAEGASLPKAKMDA